MTVAELEKLLDRAAYELSALYQPGELVEADLVLGKYAGRVLRIYEEQLKKGV